MGYHELMRTPLMAGNWKMFKTPAETKAFFEKFVPLVADAANTDVAICPPFINIPAAVDAVAGSRVTIGGQNCYWVNKEGAFTGEVNAPMLKAAGCTWVIIGHSERRQFFGETDAAVLQRTLAALEAGLKPIVCVGELLAERESGQTNEVLKTQFTGGLSTLTPEQFAEVVIAYEPVWAIGTGRTATPGQAQQVHALLRAQLLAATPHAPGMKILYGGSVKPDNARELFAQPDIDGGLIGGASLKAADFVAICRAADAT